MVMQLEKRVSEVVEFYANKKQTNNMKGISVVRDKEKERPIGNGSSNNCVNNSGSNSNSKTAGDAGRKEAVCSKRMQELMRQFGTILRQVSREFPPLLSVFFGVDVLMLSDCNAYYGWCW